MVRMGASQCSVMTSHLAGSSPPSQTAPQEASMSIGRRRDSKQE
jgi:hypothetical protein